MRHAPISQRFFALELGPSFASKEHWVPSCEPHTLSLQAGSQPDGFGLAVWDTVRKYDGQWQGGWEHGLGREAFYDGSCYGGTSPHQSLILLLLGSRDFLRGLEGYRENRAAA